jgi:hypothetical protein
MVIGVAHIQPVVALIAGVLIPRARPHQMK